MRRQILIFTLFILTLLLVACNEKETKESKADVMQKIEENMNEVKRYYTELDRSTTITNISAGEGVEEGEAKAQLNVIVEPVQIRGELCDDGEWGEYYVADAATLEKKEGKAWEDIMEHADHYRNFKPPYPEVVQIV